MGRGANAGQPERRHMGFPSFSGSFVTGRVTVVGRTGRTGFGRRGSGSDVGRAGCAASGSAARPGAGTFLGDTGGPSARPGRPGSALMGSAGRAFVGCLSCDATEAGGPLGTHAGGIRLGWPARCRARRTADRRAVME
jgi:hypothetical protein